MRKSILTILGVLLATPALAKVDGNAVVSTEWLGKNLNRSELRLIDARGDFVAYEKSHIPGAQLLNIETLRMSEGGVPCKMLPPNQLGSIFGRLGIADNPVVVYTNAPEDHLSATYVAWNLLATGHPKVALLDGSLSKWSAEKRPQSRSFPRVQTVTSTANFDSSIFADRAFVQQHLNDPKVQIVDTRTVEMYEGKEGPTQRLGHVPGAVLHDYLWDFGKNGTYLPLETLRANYRKAGITPDKEIVTYCNTGREGSAVWYVLHEMLGYPKVRLYQASMTEWTAYPELPLVMGKRPR